MPDLEETEGRHILIDAMARRKPSEVLGVDEDATIEDIRAAFRDRAKAFHPDRMGEAGREQFEEARRAYEDLSESASGRNRARRDDGSVEVPIRVTRPTSGPRRSFVEPLRPFGGSSRRWSGPFDEWIRPLESIFRRFR